MFKMWRGEPRVKQTPMALRSSSYEGCVASSTLQPCGLGCHMLGPCRTAYLGTNLIRNPASNGITSCPAPRLRRTGEDDSPKPSCNRFGSWSMDFITGFPACANGFNAIFTCVDCLTKYTILTACTLGAGELSAKQVAQLFF